MTKLQDLLNQVPKFWGMFLVTQEMLISDFLLWQFYLSLEAKSSKIF